MSHDVQDVRQREQRVHRRVPVASEREQPPTDHQPHLPRPQDRKSKPRNWNIM